MNEFDLLGPTAWGKPCGNAYLKAVADDFQVEEVLDIELTGEGEHLWLWVEKRYLNTEETAKRIAKAIHLPIRQVSYAGLKDKLALTRQWFSIHLPGKIDPDLSSLESDQLHVIKAARHQRKLQRGTHSGNRFIIRLTGLEGEHNSLEERLNIIANQGVPNYFGLQRFGFEGSNVEQALHFAKLQQYPEQRNIRSRLLSSARSYLFNKIVASRVVDNSWNKITDGDVLSFTDSRSFFNANQLEPDDSRFDALDIHATAPLFGEGELITTRDVLLKEQALLSAYPDLILWLQGAGLRQERRVLRLPVFNLQWDFINTNILQLAFNLPTGCFATAVIRELVSIKETEDKCIYKFQMMMAFMRQVLKLYTMRSLAMVVAK